MANYTMDNPFNYQGVLIWNEDGDIRYIIPPSTSGAHVAAAFAAYADEDSWSKERVRVSYTLAVSPNPSVTRWTVESMGMVTVEDLGKMNLAMLPVAEAHKIAAVYNHLRRAEKERNEQ